MRSAPYPFANWRKIALALLDRLAGVIGEP
jgi:hypothetical protein